MILVKAKKILIATLLGGLTMFIWGGLSHMVFFIGTGFKPLPNEDKVMEVLKTNIPEQGLYFFPERILETLPRSKRKSLSVSLEMDLLVYWFTDPLAGTRFHQASFLRNWQVPYCQFS